MLFSSSPVSRWQQYNNHQTSTIQTNQLKQLKTPQSTYDHGLQRPQLRPPLHSRILCLLPHPSHLLYEPPGIERLQSKLAVTSLATFESSTLVTIHTQVNNANPKASLSPSNVQGKVPDAIFQKYQRAENAHSNNMEQMPIYVAAVLASIIAERATAKGQANVAANIDATGLTTFVGAWFVVRALYNVAYVQISDRSTSYLRSLLWGTGAGLASWQIYKAAALLA